MRGINTVTILGHLGHDPELRHTAKGHQVLELGIATNRSIKRDNEWSEETDWHRVKLWNQQAEFVATHARKGDVVVVQGSLRTESWTDSATQLTRYKTYVYARRVQLPGSRRAPVSTTASADGAAGQTGPARLYEEDAIPF